jgi:rRNA maturation endonuclease Nob1
MTLRCAGCGQLWDMPTKECVRCGRDAGLNRIEWKPEYGKPKSQR